jgi:subtilisin family serine protease
MISHRTLIAFLPARLIPAAFLVIACVSAPAFTDPSGWGQFLGSFTLGERPLPLAKPAGGWTLPPAGSRAQALALVDGNFHAASLSPYGWRVGARRGSVATLEGEAASLPLLQAAAGTPDGPAGLLSVRPARGVSGAMAAARRLSRLDGLLDWGAHPNPAGVSGRGVLIGIIDFGFDTRHPAFLDSAGRSRFLAIWDPNRKAVPGAPFGRGEMKTREGIEADPDFGHKEMDLHGTLVASIAAGSDGNSPFHGVAPRAALIGVNLSTRNDTASMETNVVQGIEWIFGVADSLDLPCVVNLSLGNQHLGPHDGTSLFDRFLDGAVGPGRIVVGAVGNDGNKRLHARFGLDSGDTSGTWCPVPCVVDAWGEVGKHFRYQVLLMDSASGAWMSQTGFLSTSTGTGRLMGDSVDWSEPSTGRKVPLFILARNEREAPENRKPHAEIQVVPGSRDTTLAPRGLLMGIRLVGSGTVHAWNATSDSFVTRGMSGFVPGDDEHSLSEIGGTARGILSAGSYVSTRAYRDFKGVEHPEAVQQEVGAASAWSSRGPALDGRAKPDISAPGEIVVSALSRAVTSTPPWQTDRIVVWPDPASLSGRYLAAEGTSQSAPMVAGAVALMLEADPSLTPDMVRTILARTAYKDSFTGPLDAPDPRFGHGKLDAAAAVRSLKDVPLPAFASSRGRPVTARLQGGILRLSGLSAGEGVRGSLHDWKGRLVSPLDRLDGSRFAVRAGRPGAGVYFAVIRTPAGTHRFRLCAD